MVTAKKRLEKKDKSESTKLNLLSNIQLKSLSSTLNSAHLVCHIIHSCFSRPLVLNVSNLQSTKECPLTITEIIVTIRVRSTTQGYVFTGVSWEGVPQGTYPPPPAEVTTPPPGQVQMGEGVPQGTYPLAELTTPKARSRWG